MQQRKKQRNSKIIKLIHLEWHSVIAIVTIKEQRNAEQFYYAIQQGFIGQQ